MAYAGSITSILCTPPPPLPWKSYVLVMEVERVLCQIEHVGPVRAAKMKTTMSTCMTVTSEALAPMDYSPKKRHIFGEYTLHCRPSMRFFLGGLVKRFHLIIWTRLPSSIAKLVVDFIFGGLHADLYDVLMLEDCTCIAERRLSWMCKC